MINEILIYYRLRTLGGNLLHKNIVTMTICCQYGSIITCTILLSKSQTSALQKKLWKWEKDIKKQCNSGSALSLTFACGPAPFVHITCVSARSVCKGVGAYPYKSQNAQVYPKKLTFGLNLDVSRRILTWIVRSKVVHASQKRRS